MSVKLHRLTMRQLCLHWCNYPNEGRAVLQGFQGTGATAGTTHKCFRFNSLLITACHGELPFKCTGGDEEQFPISVPLKSSLQEMPVSMPCVNMLPKGNTQSTQGSCLTYWTPCQGFERVWWSQQMVQQNTQSWIEYWINCTSGDGEVELFVSLIMRQNCKTVKKWEY